jgi:poly-gamma-glutamate capsule biosynthesis protein CapA/YwtB (metallophosphatase superfamily)
MITFNLLEEQVLCWGARMVNGGHYHVLIYLFMMNLLKVKYI